MSLPLGAGGRRRLPRDADVAVQKRLARHTIALLELRFGQMPALLRLDRVGVLDALFDLALAGAAQSAAAFERDAALLAQGDPQQVAVLGRAGDLGIVRQKRDRNHRAARPRLALCRKRSRSNKQPDPAPIQLKRSRPGL